MKLADIRVGLPVLCLETRIFHVTPRKPTAFERVILAMADRFGNNPSFNTIPISRLFADVLSVPTPEPLLTPTLSGLISLDVIRCHADINATDKLPLGQVEITERGRRMIVEDLLPATTSSNDETFLFEPISGRLLSESEGAAYRPVQPNLALDAAIFADMFPEEVINERIRTANFRWFGATSRIERIERRSLTVLWKQAPCSVEIEFGALRLRSLDAKLDSYLASMESGDAYARIIAPLLDADLPGADRLPMLRPDELAQCAEVVTVQQAMEVWPRDAHIVIPGLGYVEERLPAQAAPHQAIILFSGRNTTSGLSFDWNDSGNGCKLLIGAEHVCPDVFRVSDREQLRGLCTEASYGDEKHEILLVQRMPASWEDETFRQMFDALESALASQGDERACHLAILWQGERQFLAARLGEAASRAQEPDLLAADFLATMDHAERLLGRLDRNAWHNGICDILFDRIARTATLSAESCQKLLTALAQHPLLPAEKVAELLQAIERKATPPQTLQALNDLTATFLLLDANWSPSCSSPLVAPELVRDLIQSFPHHFGPVPALENNSFVKPMRELLDLYGKLEAAVGLGGIASLTDEKIVRLLQSEDATRLADLAMAWTNGAEALMQALPEGATLEDTELGEIDLKVGELSTRAALQIASLTPDIRNVYVFDTCALVKEPGIVEEIRPHELFVVSKRVLDELDDKKLDEALREDVAQAVKNLSKLAKHPRLKFQDGDMSLLSPDYRKKGDNLILSVAVRYRRHRPILVTNDKNLSLKAVAEGLQTMSSDSFLNRPRSASARERLGDTPRPDKSDKNRSRKY